MQLRRTVSANNTDKSLTIAITGMLEVKIIASFSWKTNIINKNKSATARDVKTETVVANFAPFVLPAPSSFDTHTLD